MKIQSVERKPHNGVGKVYAVRLSYLGHHWTYEMTGGLLSSESKAARAATELAQGSAYLLRTSAMIGKALQGYETLQSPTQEQAQKKSAMGPSDAHSA